MYVFKFGFRSTPVETLHTVLLGPYKYLLHSLMGRLSTKEKEEVAARLVTFNFSGFEGKLGYNLCRHYRSFVGRDYKVLAQMALFVLGPYMTASEKIVWFSLSKVCIAIITELHFIVYTMSGFQGSLLPEIQFEQ